MFPSIHKLIKQTAKDLNLDPVLTEKVVMSQFLFVKNSFANPSTPLIRLEDLGKFTVTPGVLRAFFRLTKGKIQEDPSSPTLQKAIRDIARMRYISQVYYLSRKFKLRFGSWHYKAANHTTNVK